MTFSYLASFDLREPRNNLSTIQIATSGKSTISVNLFTDVDSDVNSSETTVKTTVFNHADRGLGFTIGEDRAASTPMSLSYANTSFAEVVQNHLHDAASTAGWGGSESGLIISVDLTGHTYTIQYSATMTVTFGSAETAYIFGFDTLVLSSAASYTSTITPWGMIVPVLSAVSSPTTNYEPDGISNQAISASGAVTGLSRSVAPIYRDWVQQYESKEKTLRISALSSHPFTHQELFEVCRTSLPFVVVDGFGETDENHNKEVFFFRTEGSMFKAERATESNDAQFHISYKTVVAGYVAPIEDS
jgi:hypothetical protein